MCRYSSEHAANEAMSDIRMDKAKCKRSPKLNLMETKNEFKDAPEREWAVDISMRFVQNLGD